MKVFRMAAVLALLAGPAYAQEAPHLNLLQDGAGKTEDEKAADAERERAYKETLKKIPDAKASNDPWGGMRSDPPKSTASKPAPKKTKTGSNAN